MVKQRELQNASRSLQGHLNGGEVQERTEVGACGIFADVVMGFSALDGHEEDEGRRKGVGRQG